MTEFLKGDTVVTGSMGQLDIDDELILIPIGTKALIHTLTRSYQKNSVANAYRLLFGFKDKRRDGWSSEWKPITTRMVLTEKTIITLTMGESELLDWTHSAIYHSYK